MRDQRKQLDILFGCSEESEPVTSLPPVDVSQYFTNPKDRHESAANKLTRDIIKFVVRHGGQAERIAIMGRPQQECGRVRWIRSNMTIGTADISATIHGRSVKIEVKIGADRQSDAQRKYQQAIEKAGGVYYIARDFESFVEWYKSTLK